MKTDDYELEMWDETDAYRRETVQATTADAARAAVPGRARTWRPKGSVAWLLSRPGRDTMGGQVE